MCAVKALNQARLEANVKIRGEENYKKKWPSPFAVACGALLLLSFLKYAYKPLQWLAVGAVAVGIFPITLKGLAAIRNLRLDINILVLVAGQQLPFCFYYSTLFKKQKTKKQKSHTLMTFSTFNHVGQADGYQLSYVKFMPY